MKKFALFLFTFLIVFAAFGEDLPDNVRVNEEINTYRIIAREGKPWQIKSETKQVFEAIRSDDNVMATNYYNDNISIDKASAPGAQPIYKQWISENNLYDDSRICALPISLKKGKPVKAEFKSTWKNPFIFSTLFMTRSFFTANLRVEIIVPAELANRISVEADKFTEGMKLEKAIGAKGDVTYIATATDIKPFETEDYSQPIRLASPRILIKGIFEDLGALYSYYHKFTPSYDNLSQDIVALAKSVTANAPNDIAKIDSIADWVHRNIRYVAIEHGDYALSPAAPDEVYRNRYGDCKCSASLIKGMMKAVGIDGRLVWIGTNSHSDLTWDRHPAMSTGNHMIAAAITGDSIIFVDGTTQFAPAGHIPAGIRGQQALIEDGDKYILHTVPSIPAQASLHHVDIKAVIDQGNLSGKISHTYSGDYKNLVNNICGSVASDRMEKSLTRLASVGRNDMEISDAVINGDSLNASFYDRQAVKTIGKNIYVKVAPVWNWLCSPIDKADKRRRPAVFNMRENSTSNITLAIPQGMTVKSVPKPFSIDNEWFKADIQYSVDDECVTCTSSILIKEDFVPTDKVAAWNDSLKSIIKASDSRIVIEKSI